MTRDRRPDVRRRRVMARDHAFDQVNVGNNTDRDARRIPGPSARRADADMRSPCDRQQAGRAGHACSAWRLSAGARHSRHPRSSDALADRRHAPAAASDDGRRDRRGLARTRADARRHARGRDGVPDRTGDGTRSERCDHARHGGDRAHRERRGVRVPWRQGRRRDDDGRHQRRDRAVAACRWLDDPHRSAPCVRRRRGLPGNRAAVLGHRRA